MNSPENFVKLANQFCEWVESDLASEEFDAKKLVYLLSGLCFEVLQLKYEPSQVSVDAERVSQEELYVIFKKFSVLPINYYSVVSDPLNLENASPVIGDIADDLADIYRDLKSGLWLFNRGYKVEAYNEWKESFNCHWGTHATSALNVLQAYVSSGSIKN